MHSDEGIGWSGFLSYRCGVVIENVIYIIDYLNRQPLWNFMKAAFPRARYCLSSATLTDAYVKDILSTKALPGLLYLLQHLDSSLNTGPCLLKLLGVLAPITILLRLLELHLSLSSFSWEAPPSQLPGSICPSFPPSAPSSIWCRCTKSTSSWALASWCLSRATGAPPSPRVWLPLPHQLLRDQPVLLPVCVRETLRV